MHRKERIFRNCLLLIVLIGTPLMLWFDHYSNKTFTKAQIDEMFAPITSKYGIKIVYEIGDDFFSDINDPALPAGPDRRSKVSPIRHRVLSNYPEGLQISLAKYPVEVIKRHLNTIQFVGEIDFDGFKYGGCYDLFRKIIYLVDNGQKNDVEKMSTFHHELSSLLIHVPSFPVKQWFANNPTGYKYLLETYKNWDVLQQKVDISKESNKDYEKGFLCVYGQTTFENDFNEYSAMIFTSPEKFKKIMNQYPRVRGKFKVWLAFYHQIDPMFTEEYLLGAHQQDRADAGMD